MQACHGGTCVETDPPDCSNPFECHCPKGFENDPVACEKDVDECDRSQ